MRKRFIIENDTCFVVLLDHKPRVGLCLQGVSQMEEFCKAAIDAYDEMLKKKNRGKSLDIDNEKLELE